MPLTAEQYEALPGAEKNAAVARALRWEHRRVHLRAGQMACGGFALQDGKYEWWERGGERRAFRRYVTAGDGDPFASWDLLAEMVMLLRGCPRVIEFIIGALHSGTPVARLHLLGWDAMIVLTSLHSWHRLVAAALAAAGLLEEPQDA